MKSLPKSLFGKTRLSSQSRAAGSQPILATQTFFRCFTVLAAINILFVCIVFATASASAALAPDEVAIIAMAESKDSRNVAEYYAKARGIPQENILLLEGRPSAFIVRDRWEKKIRPAIVKLLEKHNLAEKIRCLVTCWDVPLFIGRRSISMPQFRARKYGLEKQRADIINEFDELLAAMDAYGRDEPPRKKLPLLSNSSEEQLKSSFNAAMQDVQQRSRGKTSDVDKARLAALLQRCFIMANGNEGLVKILTARTESDSQSTESKTKRAMLVARIQTLQQVVSELELLPGSEATDQLIIKFLTIRSGLFGALSWIDKQQTLLQKNESHSSFDSELSLIFYPDYNEMFWLPNPLYYGFGHGIRRRVIMVSRLEAPSLEIVKKMIDDAVATEKSGLQGHVYIDARGLRPKAGNPDQNAYYIYDKSLCDLAQRLRKHTSLTVVSDKRSELFQPGSCPNAALYCGWYSVRQYVDAFEWNRGAVAYHLASYEAKWLRKPEEEKDSKENPWCPAMLEDGVCATLGPVTEPYLSSFPLPDDFFPLLLTGKMTLAEIYYRTKRFNSWTLILIGDPLYTPYKANPQLDAKDLPARLFGERRRSSGNEAEPVND